MERATGQRDFGVQELPNRGTDLASGVVRGFFSRRGPKIPSGSKAVSMRLSPPTTTELLQLLTYLLLNFPVPTAPAPKGLTESGVAGGDSRSPGTGGSLGRLEKELRTCQKIAS